MHATVQPKKIGSVSHAGVMRGCVPLSASYSLIYHFWSLKHHHSAATRHHHRPWKLHAFRANNNNFLYFLFYFLLYVFGIVFNCIIQNNSYCLHRQYFLYNYLRQMHQIIHLSLVGCFTTARGKTVQKNREVSWVNDRISVWKPRGRWFEFAVASKVFSCHWETYLFLCI